MSAQHHRRTFRQWLADPFGKNQPKSTGWTRHKPVTYPLPMNATPASGHGHRMIQPTGPLFSVQTMQQAIPQNELSIEQLNRIASRLSPEGIAQLPTIKDLRTEQLPDHVLQQMANAGRLADNQQIMARAHQVQALKKQGTAPFAPVQRPPWAEPVCQQLSTEQLPEWLTKDPPISPKKSGFLLSANEVILEEDDPEATVQRKAIKIEKKEQE